MNYQIRAGQRSGIVSVPGSKSAAHRLLICAALSNETCTLTCGGISKDISATVNCLRSLGSEIELRADNRIRVTPQKLPEGAECHLPCNESGSTLRFLLPTAGALGCKAVFHMADGLAKRPMAELIDTLEAHGVKITKGRNEIISQGRLSAGEYIIPGDVSSQYISGLLFALPLLNGESTLKITGSIESRDYILMTEAALKQAGIVFKKEGNMYLIPGGQQYRMKEKADVEPDWSNAAFFLCMGALSKKGVTVNEISLSSAQGDKEILNVLRRFGAETEFSEKGVTVRRGKLTGVTVDASTIPDLVPTISALAACAEGTTRIENAGRLRFKESDRLKTTSEMLTALGADIEELRDGLVIHGRPYLDGGTADAANDHRIAMAAAVAACSCRNDVCVSGAECVDKSYPDFWKHLETLEVLA